MDNGQSYLDTLNTLAEQRGFAGRIETRCASMTELPFEKESFDLLWSEGSAYIMGFCRALEEWRDLIKAGGHLVVNDLVWTSERVEDEVTDFWRTGYPDMQQARQRLRQCRETGVQCRGHCHPWSGCLGGLQATS